MAEQFSSGDYLHEYAFPDQLSASQMLKGAFLFFPEKQHFFAYLVAFKCMTNVTGKGVGLWLFVSLCP